MALVDLTTLLPTSSSSSFSLRALPTAAAAGAATDEDAFEGMFVDPRTTFATAKFCTLFAGAILGC